MNIPATCGNLRHVTSEQHKTLIGLRRTKLGLTQAEAGRKIGMSREQWNQTEAGNRGVGRGVAKRIAKLLGGDVEDYVRPAGPRSPISIAEETVKLLTEGGQVPVQRRLRLAEELEETAEQCRRLAEALRLGSEASGSNR